MMKKALAAMALAGMAMSAHATVAINEGFDNVDTLASQGWIRVNAGTPGGLPAWNQGDQQQFSAQAGDPNSFISANYNNAPAGGTIDSWLITPEFSASGDVIVNFWLRAATDPGYTDQITYGFSSGGNLLSDFTMGPLVTASTDGWVEYTAFLHAMGPGSTARFAIEYTGAADTSNLIGVDTLSVTVPEPTSALLFAAGVLGLSTVRRRQRR